MRVSTMYIICRTAARANVYIIYISEYISTKVERLMQIARTIGSQKDRFDFINTANGVTIIKYLPHLYAIYTR